MDVQQETAYDHLTDDELFDATAWKFRPDEPVFDKIVNQIFFDCKFCGSAKATQTIDHRNYYPWGSLLMRISYCKTCMLIKQENITNVASCPLNQLENQSSVKNVEEEPQL